MVSVWQLLSLSKRLKIGYSLAIGRVLLLWQGGGVLTIHLVDMSIKPLKERVVDEKAFFPKDMVGLQTSA